MVYAHRKRRLFTNMHKLIYVITCKDIESHFRDIRACKDYLGKNRTSPSCNRYKIILYRQLSQSWHPWISVTQFDADVSRSAFIRTIRWVTFVHRNCRRATTLSDISCRSEPYKKDDNDEEAVLVRDGIYFVHESLRFFS